MWLSPPGTWGKKPSRWKETCSQMCSPGPGICLLTRVSPATQGPAPGSPLYPWPSPDHTAVAKLAGYLLHPVREWLGAVGATPAPFHP